MTKQFAVVYLPALKGWVVTSPDQPVFSTAMEAGLSVAEHAEGHAIWKNQGYEIWTEEPSLDWSKPVELENGKQVSVRKITRPTTPMENEFYEIVHDDIWYSNPYLTNREPLNHNSPRLRNVKDASE